MCLAETQTHELFGLLLVSVVSVDPGGPHATTHSAVFSQGSQICGFSSSQTSSSAAVASALPRSSAKRGIWSFPRSRHLPTQGSLRVGLSLSRSQPCLPLRPQSLARGALRICGSAPKGADPSPRPRPQFPRVCDPPDFSDPHPSLVILRKQRLFFFFVTVKVTCALRIPKITEQK